MSADIIDINSRLRRPLRIAAKTEDIQVWHCVLLSDDVSIGELMHALRRSDIRVSTDPDTGMNTIHRASNPQDAA